MHWSHGEIHWTELMTRDPAGARAFYEKTVGWSFVENPMGPEMPYLVATLGEKPACGIYDISGDEFAGASELWLPYIAVENVDAAMATVEPAGGRVLRAAFDLPKVGRFGVALDRGGAMFGLITPETPAG